MIQRKASPKDKTLKEFADQNGSIPVTKKTTWFSKSKQAPTILIPDPKPFKSQQNHSQQEKEDKLSKRRSWFHKSSGETARTHSSIGTSMGKTPENLQQTKEVGPSAESNGGTRSKHWFSRATHKPNPILPSTLASSESEHHDLLSTESIEILGSNVISLIKRLEEDDSMPIVFGNYSGEPVYKRDVTEPAIFNSQLVKFSHFDQFEEATYHAWNVWQVGHDGTKKVDQTIECKVDFVDFFKKFNYQKVYIMRDCLVPNHNSFKNGYLVKLKLLHERSSTGADWGLHIFMTCCKNAILNNVPNNAIKINVCGFTYTKRSSLTQITLWIHPIMNMSFDISNQVSLLIKSLNLEARLNKITLVDVNNGSKTEIIEKS
ncbi:hypothetical protein CANMA_004327 [Candida margitis]|uniref:uncharacterized protein n=1 Tax=Candida margitis TaxID=1775924 RepID=UPI002227B0B4|nr:uncharacterized protein CANMA_004327 [Candida margitis]KAI5957895.1 hypothetical protein CANMA_004327 [Candida margitis]